MGLVCSNSRIPEKCGPENVVVRDTTPLPSGLLLFDTSVPTLCPTTTVSSPESTDDMGPFSSRSEDPGRTSSSYLPPPGLASRDEHDPNPPSQLRPHPCRDRKTPLTDNSKRPERTSERNQSLRTGNLTEQVVLRTVEEDRDVSCPRGSGEKTNRVPWRSREKKGV